MKLNYKTGHKRCLVLQKIIPKQIFPTETVILKALYISISTMVYLLVVKKIEKTMTGIHDSFVLKNAVPILILTHTVCINVNLSGAAKQFN